MPREWCPSSASSSPSLGEPMKNASIRKIVSRPARRRGIGGELKTWTRRLHFYLGLYLLLFLWLFSISGLFLNHPEWEITHGFWEQRQESSSERVIAPPRTTGDLAIAKGLMRQLGLTGEVNEIDRSTAEDQFSFRVDKPGQSFRVDVRGGARSATVTRIDLNVWGVLNGLHTFTGVSMNDPARERDWVLTTIWSIAMDAVALGLMVLVLSGLYLWFRLKKKRLLGLLVLGAGTASCGFFVLGITGVF